LGHLDAVLGGQMIEGHARVVGPLPEGMDIGRAVGEDAQHPIGGDAVGREQQVFLRRLIHPVGVLKDGDLRTHFSSSDGEAPQRIEDLAPALLRVHGQHRWIARIDGQQVAQVREERPQIFAQPEDPALDLRHDRPLGVTLLDAEIAPQHVDQGVKRHGAPERHRPSFDPSGFVAEPPAELEEEAGLTDAGLPDDEDDLPMTRPSLLEAFEEELQLAVSANERR
jgi:hypothetical protein